jgi:DNA helicase-2/ATP-dependent DNA helicase PcrA
MIPIEPTELSAVPRVGDTVFHSRFGRGEVLEAEGRGEQYRVKVNFDTHGLKWLMAKFANLQVFKNEASS